RVILDTRHFRGNFPESAAVDGCCADGIGDDEVRRSAGGGDGGRLEWFPLVGRTPLSADAEHEFVAAAGGLSLEGRRRTTHVRVTIYPRRGTEQGQGVRRPGRRRRRGGIPAQPPLVDSRGEFSDSLGEGTTGLGKSLYKFTYHV
ncbi:hypothetical protein THAOC_24883, partial [Thalassiosira oceanica]